MTRRVSQEMVFLYRLNRLSPADRLLVEEAFPTNLQVQAWFVDFGGPIPERSGLPDVGFQGSHSRTNYATCS